MAVSLGSDLSCITDLDPVGQEVNEKLCLAQGLARRFITPRGRLIDDPNYGYDLTQWLGADIGKAELAQIQAAITAECLKDERVQSASAVVTYMQSVMTMIVTISLVAATGPFQLVLSVNNVSTQIITVT